MHQLVLRQRKLGKFLTRTRRIRRAQSLGVSKIVNDKNSLEDQFARLTASYKRNLKTESLLTTKQSTIDSDSQNAIAWIQQTDRKRQGRCFLGRKRANPYEYYDNLIEQWEAAVWRSAKSGSSKRSTEAISGKKTYSSAIGIIG